MLQGDLPQNFSVAPTSYLHWSSLPCLLCYSCIIMLEWSAAEETSWIPTQQCLLLAGYFFPFQPPYNFPLREITISPTVALGLAAMAQAQHKIAL